MTHKLIYTPDYLLVVDNSRVIAHLPINNSPILTGVDLLPSLEQEDDVERLIKIEQEASYKQGKGTISWYEQEKRKEYYNKAKEKYKYTEEDVKIAIQQAFLSGVERLEDFEKVEKMTLENIQSLSQPKIPVGFECEIEYFYMASKMFYKDADWVKCNKDQYESIKEEIPTCPLKKVHKEISTPEGHTQWVGKYIF